MFIINLTYKVGLKEVDEYLDMHIDFLKKQYVEGNFIASGRKEPRTGGIIFSSLKSKEKLQAIIEDDPFKLNDLAVYDIIEFIPNMTSLELEFLKK